MQCVADPKRCMLAWRRLAAQLLNVNLDAVVVRACVAAAEAAHAQAAGHTDAGADLKSVV